MSAPTDQYRIILLNALERRELFLFVGSGVPSNAIRSQPEDVSGRYTWDGVIRHGIEYVQKVHPHLEADCQRRLDELDSLSNLNATDTASFIRTKLALNNQQQCWEALFDPLSNRTAAGGIITNPEILDVIHDLRRRGARVLTTNYDLSIEHSTTDHVIALHQQESDRTKTVRWLSDGYKPSREDFVFHLHGHYMEADSMVLDDLSYAALDHNVHLKNTMQNILARVVLFVGCGLTGGLRDEHIGPLLTWLEKWQAGVRNRLFLLMPSIVPTKANAELRKAIQTTRNINIIYYGGDRNAHLVPFLKHFLLGERSSVPSSPLSSVSSPSSSSAASSSSSSSFPALPPSSSSSSQPLPTAPSHAALRAPSSAASLLAPHIAAPHQLADHALVQQFVASLRSESSTYHHVIFRPINRVVTLEHQSVLGKVERFPKKRQPITSNQFNEGHYAHRGCKWTRVQATASLNHMVDQHTASLWSVVAVFAESYWTSFYIILDYPLDGVSADDFRVNDDDSGKAFQPFTVLSSQCIRDQSFSVVGYASWTLQIPPAYRDLNNVPKAIAVIPQQAPTIIRELFAWTVQFTVAMGVETRSRFPARLCEVLSNFSSFTSSTPRRRSTPSRSTSCECNPRPC